MESPARPGLRDALGDVLRDERHRQQRTLRDVADDAAVSVPYLSEVERGRKEPSSEMIAALAGALGTSVGELVGQVAEMMRRRATVPTPVIVGGDRRIAAPMPNTVAPNAMLLAA